MWHRQTCEMCMHPPPRGVCTLADGAVGGGEEAKEAAATLQVLHELAGVYRERPRRRPSPTERCRPPSPGSCD